MKVFRKIFSRLAGAGMKRYCSCGHVVSANLAFCPHCGCRLTEESEYPMD